MSRSEEFGRGRGRPIVKIADLHYTQPAIGERVANAYRDHPVPRLPQVYYDEGKPFVDDGHHRVEGARRRGDTEIRVLNRGDAGGLLASTHKPETCPACGGTPRYLP